MISKTKVIISKVNDPYHNLALEEYLLDEAGDDTCILYLWQNKNTVVIGQNQNAWQECKVKELERDGGHLARRLSGGGAVFHDMGNLNFTFLVPRGDYDVAKQCEVIKLAASYFGLDVERTGRNDILIEGKKFSGNAFYKNKKSAYHHGTILISSDMTVLPRYLNVSKEKLESKGVKSVASRVGNLSDFSPDVTVSSMTEKLIRALEEVYKIKPSILEEEDLNKGKIEELRQKYASWEWIFGRKLLFTNEFSKRFPWGGINICLRVERGIIEEAKVYSDAMDSSFIGLISSGFKGKKYESESLKGVIRSLKSDCELGYEADENIFKDIEELIDSQNF